MNHLNDLPIRHENHATESKAESAFQSLLSDSEDFVLQGSDNKDYGTDYQIEVVYGKSATNIRIHVQLKGTERIMNADESVSICIDRSNLNYLMMQPHSFFACYHVPTDRLLYCSVDAVLRKYENSGQNWTQQKTLTVTFSETLTKARLKSLADLARSDAAASRNKRFAQITAHPQALPSVVKATRPDLHVPHCEVQAAEILSSLYDSGSNDIIISDAFERFAAVLPRDHDAMIFCYMAEINLAMAGYSCKSSRIADGISFLKSKISTGRHHVGSLQYSIGNGFSAQGCEQEAIQEYELALQFITCEKDASLLAQCYKNLGSSYSKLGYGEKAAESFRLALHHNSQLPEAHFALGLHLLRNGEYEKALECFDRVVFPDCTHRKQSSVAGWRINALFNLGDERAAFREINMLLSGAADDAWIWPWCARQVASFGRSSSESSKLSILFWDRYLKEQPNCPLGVRERLLNKLYLQSEGQIADMTYLAFKAEFEIGI